MQKRSLCPYFITPLGEDALKPKCDQGNFDDDDDDDGFFCHDIGNMCPFRR